ncbi:hypothetical protein [Nodularia spumigena]|jgi:hypothetical protein|uniref:hypothetical protein n=1 Tax=Nodularia spumigena TaxID=70799 RepID=UPI002B1F8652|nr:hypothetical protein [Nodularia spumigena]MEA5615410.1 hypothetical protein [Nodularia spumigena UHCC 0040]
MLVKVIDHKGKERYINAAFIKSIAPKNETQAEIEVSGWAMKVRVDQTADQVAAVINAALPSNLDALLATEAEQQQQNETAIIAVIG